LQICWLKFEQQLVIPPGLCIVAEFVVSEGEVVETLAATFTRPPEDIGQEAHAFLLVRAVVGLDQTLRGVSWCAEDGRVLWTNPGIVELGLEADIFAFLLILCAQDLEFVGLERRLYVGSICTASVPARARHTIRRIEFLEQLTW
jgi:hypothetical protein